MHSAFTLEQQHLANLPTTNGRATLLADLAVTALIAEATLTPKPALVDSRGPGAHTDLNLALMLRSAHALHSTFVALACAASGQLPDQVLRERLAAIGREGEQIMLAATGGINTHRGAIWALGLLIAGAALTASEASAHVVAACAGEIARYPDRYAPSVSSHGACMEERYGVQGARGEAQQGFPHVINVGLPALRGARMRGVPETLARLDALLAIMAHLDDTCLLYRGGYTARNAARYGAQAVLAAGGTSTPEGRAALLRLDKALLALNASPGGSADLLAATLFLDAYEVSSFI
jgi:triphosphoribosyl-dephospho-CoA synthase